MKYLKVLVVFCVLALFAIPAHALPITITPTTGSLVDPITRWEGNETSQAAIDVIVFGITGYSSELYKSDVNNVGPPTESGPLAGSYDTTFANTPNDPSDATIVYTGGDIVGPVAYLLVKGGNQIPAWYLFNLTVFGWDGMETLNLTGFWPYQGAISHVSLYGDKVPVPEPATMLLLGFGLIGLAVVGKRNFRKI